MLGALIGDTAVFDVPLVEVEPPELRAALVRAWKTIVFNNSIAYLRYRVDRFRVVLGIQTNDEDVWNRPIIVTHDYQDTGALIETGIPTAISPVQAGVDSVQSWLSHGPLFRPYVYFVLALVLLVLGRRNRLIVALILSGLGLELSLFFLAATVDYRYSHWLICVTLLAGILFAVDRLRARAVNLGAQDR
jgi:hypothetical protein